MRTVALDFDGVIHRYSRGWDNGLAYDMPMDGTSEAMSKLHRMGFCIVVHTCREPEQVAVWFAEHLPEFRVQIMKPDEKFWNSPDMIGVTNTKPAAFAYIDDRGIHFKSWKRALQTLALRSELDSA
jgi:hypothetical protein